MWPFWPRLTLICIWTQIFTAAAFPGPRSHPAQQPLLANRDRFLPSWRRLANLAIENIWRPDRDGKGATHGFRGSGYTSPRPGSDLVIRFNMTTRDDAKALAHVAEYMFLDIWQSRWNWVEIRMSVDKLPVVLNLLPESLSKSHSILLDDRALQEGLSNTVPSSDPEKFIHAFASNHINTGTCHACGPNTPANPPSSNRARSRDGPFFNQYQPYPVIQHWLRLLSSLYSTHVRTIKLGHTAEGRPIDGVRIGVEPHNRDAPLPPRKTILVVGNLQGRDWLATSSVNYLIHSLSTAYGRSRNMIELLQAYSFILVPTLNPDGYIYTWTTDRFWRKTRQTSNSRVCQGFDLSSSFPTLPKKKQSSSQSDPIGDPCSNQFSGTADLQSTESRVLIDWLAAQTSPSESASNSTRPGIELVSVLDLQSYGQEIVYPSSHPCSESAPWELQTGRDTDDGDPAVEAVANLLASHVSTPSSRFEVKSICETEYLERHGNKGGLVEWLYQHKGVRNAFQIKLGNGPGFLSSPATVVETGRQVYSILLRLANAITNGQ